jgi:hypothetical protein
MASPSTKRSTAQVAVMCRLAKRLLDAADDLKQINFEVQNGIVDFGQLDYTVIGLPELDAQALNDGCNAAEAIVNNNVNALTRLAAYGSN